MIDTIEVSGLTIQNGVGTVAGGIKISDSGPIYDGFVVVERNIFRDNTGTVYQEDNSAGALVANTDGPDFSGNVFLTVRNNLFVGNRAPNAAGASFYSNNTVDVTGNTFTGNQSTAQVVNPPLGIVYAAVSAAVISGFTFSNNVFWANNPDNIAATFDLNASSTLVPTKKAKLFNNDVQTISGTPAVAQDNKNLDPQFADAANGNFRLAGTSPLIDAGLDTADGGIGTVDLDGAERLHGLHVDIGAYEFDEIIFANGFD